VYDRAATVVSIAILYNTQRRNKLRLFKYIFYIENGSAAVEAHELFG
jgi:hypothetical protein